MRQVCLKIYCQELYIAERGGMGRDLGRSFNLANMKENSPFQH